MTLEQLEAEATSGGKRAAVWAEAVEGQAFVAGQICQDWVKTANGSTILCLTSGKKFH